jgi:hypothetical protein
MLITLPLLSLAYIGSYFAVLELPANLQLPPFSAPATGGVEVRFVEVSGQWKRFPDYHGLPNWLFAPLHEYDRTHLRPNLWCGSSPRNQELSFDWLLGAGPADVNSR